MASDRYRAQVQLLVRTLTFVARETCFALKGGTAINLFVRDMPRLSVDIDLTYVPVDSRAKSLKAIEAALLRIGKSIERGLKSSRAATVPQRGDNAITGLNVSSGRAAIKIEVSPVLRGCVFPPEVRAVSPSVERDFGFAEVQVVSNADLYAGKFVAALDRQHPRDLFDVREFLRTSSIDDELRAAFAVYLASGSRPTAELLNPTPKDISQEFERGLAGMTEEPVTLAELIETRARLARELAGGMPMAHRRFLLSVERGEPDWSLLAIPGLDKLPAVQWRLKNIGLLSASRREANVSELAMVLGISRA